MYHDGPISLGAVRLSIIDLAGGDQPMATEDGKHVIAFNGEVYNHAELRRELEGLGHRFHSRCDTEVVLRAFAEWDTDCFRRLRGMFAAAIWCSAERRLVLVRDRMGIKPLYYLERDGEIYFGSELKVILGHPEIRRTLNLEGLHYFLSLNYIPSPHTMISGIEKVPAGHFLEWRDGRSGITQWWRLELREETRHTLESAKEELDGLLRASVKEHLVSDVPLGVWASGGVDSSTIVHYAAEAYGGRLKTFSVSFKGRRFDESPYFRAIAERYGTDHHEFDLNPREDLAGAIEQIPYYSDEPSADAGALPVWFLSQMTRRHVTVALSGEGADEVFGGYYTYLADRYSAPLRRTPAILRRAALRALKYWPVSDEKVGLDYKLKRFLEGSLLPAADAHFYWNGSFGEAEKHKLLNRNGFPTVGKLIRNLPEGAAAGGLNRFLWLDQLYYLADDILYKCDRMSMAHSLEVRPPFLDHRIVEFAARLPESLKIRGSRLKFVLKELMRDRLPGEILFRKKEGFDIPAHDWFRGPLRGLLLDTINERSVREMGLFEWPVVDRLIRSHLERRANLGYQLWGLLTLFLWMKRWGVQVAPPTAVQVREQAEALTSN